MCMDRKKILEKIQWRPSGTTSQYIIKCLVTLAQKSSIKKKSQATQSSPWAWDKCVWDECVWDKCVWDKCVWGKRK